VGETAAVMPRCEPIKDKWGAFGWHVLEMDGHDVRDILSVLDEARQHRDEPTVVISHTIKGKGVSYMENNVAWHSRGLTDAELDQAIRELNNAGGPDRE
jgi:transketolase